MRMTQTQLSELINNEFLELPIRFLLCGHRIFRFLSLSQFVMYDTDMICHNVHDTPLHLLYLCHIRLPLDTPIHHLKLLHQERL